MNSTFDEFRQAITAAGLEAPTLVHGDGAIHRFSCSGRGSDKAGWYMLYADGIPAGAFSDWRSGLQLTWCAKSDNTMTDPERETHRQRTEAMKAQREADILENQQEASNTAAALWASADAATVHNYLTIKGIKSHGVKSLADKLLIPMRDSTGALHSLQTIAPNGDKRFHLGGRVKGCYHSIGQPDGVLVICEGYATGASIYECTEHAVAVAFNAGNLETVALALHAKYPSLKIIIAADDDHLTDGNPGLIKATAAARAVGGLLATPLFPAGRPDKATDFNDLHQLAGSDAVKASIKTAIDLMAVGASIAGDNGLIDVWPEPTP